MSFKNQAFPNLLPFLLRFLILLTFQKSNLFCRCTFLSSKKRGKGAGPPLRSVVAAKGNQKGGLNALQFFAALDPPAGKVDSLLAEMEERERWCSEALPLPSWMAYKCIENEKWYAWRVWNPIDSSTFSKKGASQSEARNGKTHSTSSLPYASNEGRFPNSGMKLMKSMMKPWHQTKKKRQNGEAVPQIHVMALSIKKHKIFKKAIQLWLALQLQHSCLLSNIYMIYTI